MFLRVLFDTWQNLWISFISFSFCATLLWFILQHILKAMWKSTRFSRHFSVIFFSSIQRHSLVFQKKCCLNFWSTHPLTFQKIVFMKILGNFPLKHAFWSLLFEFICRPSRCVKYHLPREVHVYFRHSKRIMPKKF